ncbi:sialidase family protein [Chitinophaga sp. GCM10012297]|uniref:Exo-alpha-sialidase n=1 Tax=Chitinophaga chungangae TaxID=2821488 RepID=A0ABS3Y7J7_9BACT|nr:sialidase family protein [Chitinophaga chungangae]MBO9150646.1 exo-alpha-sialidase [Chitinophaga chungangae]
MKQLVTILVLFLAACHGPQFSGGVETAVSDTTRIASCTYLTRDASGKVVLSWVEQQVGEETGTLFYAVSPDEGKTFPAGKLVPTAQGILPHGENMPKMIFRPNGEVIAMYGAQSNDPRNKYAGKVFYTISPDGGATWQPSVPLVTDPAGYDQRYFDMVVLPSGEAAVIWLDNRKLVQKEGSTLYIATTGGTPGFHRERPIVQTVCQCCRTALYVDAQGGLHAAFRDIIQDTIRDMVHIFSKDGGETFTQPVRISADNWAINGCPHTGPAMVRNANGLHFAWFTMGGGEGVFYCQSPDNGITYTRKENISALPTAKHPQLAVLGKGDLALVWDEAADTSGNRIGILHKSADGKTLNRDFLTAETEFAGFPVLEQTAEGVLVAYKKRRNGKEGVYVKSLRL